MSEKHFTKLLQRRALLSCPIHEDELEEKNEESEMGDTGNVVSWDPGDRANKAWAAIVTGSSAASSAVPYHGIVAHVGATAASDHNLHQCRDLGIRLA
jgi:hypothetical protein